MIGYTPEEHYEDPDLSLKLVHPEDKHLISAVAEEKTAIDKPLVLRWVCKDGHVIWAELNNVPIFDEAGNLIAIEGIARDITERKKAEEVLREKLDELKAVNKISVALRSANTLDEMLMFPRFAGH